MPRLQSITLGTALGAGTVLIVLIAVLAVALSSQDLLSQLASRQALTRAQLAAAAASEYVRRVAEDVFASAQVLSDRPTFQRMLGQEDWRAMEPFLRRFCTSTDGDVCALMGNGISVQSTSSAVPWDEVEAAHGEQGDRFLLAPRHGGAPIAGASVALSTHPGMRVLVLRYLGGRLLPDVRDQVGATVNITNYATYAAPEDDPFTELHSLALSDGRAAARRMARPDVYAATSLLTSTTGEIVALIDVQLPAAEFDAAVQTLVRRLAIIAIIVIAITGLAGVLYGRWLVTPVRALREAADSIGRGSFSTAVPVGGANEVAALSTTMEEMRRNLVELTSTLRRREAEARAVLSGIVEGVYSVDLERRIRYANPQAARLLGRSPEELIGQFCGDVLNPEPVDGRRPCEHHCPILRARSQGSSRAEERLRLGQGAPRSTVIVSAAPVEGQQVQVIRDETELEAARRARDSVLANISHEFRTPLAAQLASVELLRDGVERLTSGEQAELFANLERGVLRLMRLIDNLLESVRIESGQLALRSGAVVPAEMIEEAAAFVRPLLAQRRQRLRIDVAPDLPILSGDGQRLAQVFVNLLANASKFSPDGSEVRVGSGAADGVVRLWVEDEGSGVAEDDHGALFERFTRARDTEPAPPGLGLGLWIVKSIVERHGGSIRIDRTAEQRTRFTVELPAGTAE